MKQKLSAPSEYIFAIKVLIVLFALTPLIPRLETIDPIGTQWLYLSIVNCLGFFILFKTLKSGYIQGIIAKHYLLFGYLIFILIASLSLIGALNISEGIRSLSRLVTVGIAVTILSRLLLLNIKSFFVVLQQALALIAIIISVQIVFHFIENWETPRFRELLKGIELLFGNRNITAAYLAIVLPLSIMGFYRSVRIWRWIFLLSFFLSFTAIFYIGARSALLSSSIIIIVSIIFIFLNKHTKESASKNFVNRILPLLITLVASFLIVTNSNRIDKSKSNDLVNIISTLSNISELENQDIIAKSTTSSARKIYYQITLDNVIENPFLGIGIGNWRLINKDKYYSVSSIDKYIYPARTHNDFLQLFSETGILGGAVYLSLFGYLFISLIALIRRETGIKKQQYFTLFLMLVAYGIDALLNFPMERAPIQSLLLFIFAFDIVQSVKIKENKLSNVNGVILSLLAIITIGALVVSYLNYKAFVNESYILADSSKKDLFSTKYVYSYDQARGRLDNIFNLTAGGKPVDHYLAMYAYNSGNEKLALKHLDKAIQVLPHHYESKGLKAIIFEKNERTLDSAIHYAKEGFEKYPSIKNNYVILLNSFRKKGDTLSYFQTYDNWLDKFPNDVSQWKAKAERQFEYYKDSNLVLETIDKGIELNPDEESLKKYKLKYTVKNRSGDIRAWYKQAFTFIEAKDYKNAKIELLKILDISPRNTASLINLGIIEIKMKQYSEAIDHLSTLIDSKALVDGRAEYNRGLAYEKMGDVDNAKKDYKKSKELGYKLALKLPKNKTE